MKNELSILHIACTNGDPSNGVHVVIPQHLKYQSALANVAFLNVSNIRMKCSCPQFEYTKSFDISLLDEPFNKPDIVVFHECYRIQYIKIAKQLRKKRIPYVIVPHGELSDGAQAKKALKKRTANLLFFNNFIENAVAIQCLSEKEKETTHFKNKKFVGTNGIEIPTCQKQYLLNDELKMVYIGRLDVYHKGLDILINAVAMSHDVMLKANCSLDIYGPDKLGRFDQVKSLVEEKKVNDVVNLHHEVFGAEKERILLSSDIFVQTSRFEGMPMGILEALSYGIPCLVTEGTNVKNIVEESNAGWGVTTNSVSVSKAITIICGNNNDLKLMGKNALDMVKENFSWETIANKTVEQYIELLNI